MSAAVRIELTTKQVQALVEEAVKLQYRSLRDCVVTCALTIYAKDDTFKIRCIVTGRSA